MAGNHTLGTIRGTIEIDYDGAGIVRAVRDTDKAKRGMGDLDKSVSGILSTFGKFAKGAVIAGAAASTLTSSVHLLVAVLATVGPIAAAGMAVLPGVILGAAAAVGIMKIATLGMADALKAAGEDAEKFEEATKNLSPSAKDFAQAVRALLPALRNAQKAIQEAFFRGLSPILHQITGRILSLRAQAIGVAGAINGIVKNVLQFATSGRSIENVRLVLSGVTAFLLKIRSAIGPVVARFIDLAAQASEFGGTLGGKVADALSKFSAFLGRIDVGALLQNALPILQALGGFLSNVGTIARELFGIFNTDGANAAGILGELAAKLAAFLQSAEGQAALQAIGQAMQAIAGSAGQVFLTLLQQLGPIIVKLAPGVADLATQIANVLVPALEAVGPILADIAGFLSDNMSWLGPVAGAVLAVAAAYRVYTAATKAWAAAEAIASALRAKAVIQWVATTAATIANTVATGANAAMRAGAFVASWIASTAVMIAQKAAMVANLVIMGVVRAATIAWTAVQWLLNIALLANPIGLVIIAIVLLVAGIILLWKKSETFRTIVLAVWAAIKVAAKATADWFMNTLVPFLKKAWDLIVAGVKFFVNIAIANFKLWQTVISTVVNVIKTIVTTVWNAIGNIIRAAVDRVKATIEGIKIIVSRISTFFSQARTAVIDRINALVAFVKSIPGRIVGALGNLGAILYSKGRSIIEGLINGIKSMFGAVANVARNIVGTITDFFPGSPAKEGPLSGQGYALYRGRHLVRDFASGVLDAEGAARSAMERVMNSAIGRMPLTTPTGVGVAPTTTITPRTAPPAPTPAGPGVAIGTLTVPITGVWDFNDASVPRQIAAKIHTAIEDYKKEHR